MELSRVLKLHKPIGMTSLELIDQLRHDRPDLSSIKLAYAGRLDPMAEGEMLILVGEECLQRKKYERLNKEYEFEVLFGVSTDSYDVLGKIGDIKLETVGVNENSLTKLIPPFIGKHWQEYPPFSSPRIQGKSLWWWAKENRLHEIEIPKKEVEIYDMKLIKLQTRKFVEVHSQIVEKIHKVKGEFRQKEIIEGWDNLFKLNNDATLLIAKLRVLCSSGTYVRSLGNEIGKKLGIPTLTFSIKRTKIIID